MLYFCGTRDVVSFCVFYGFCGLCVMSIKEGLSMLNMALPGASFCLW